MGAASSVDAAALAVKAAFEDGHVLEGLSGTHKLQMCSKSSTCLPLGSCYLCPATDAQSFDALRQVYLQQLEACAATERSPE
eukprot:14043-Heterococcus_DN1.PRE.2